MTEVTAFVPLPLEGVLQPVVRVVDATARASAARVRTDTNFFILLFCLVVVVTEIKSAASARRAAGRRSWPDWFQTDGLRQTQSEDCV